ncbi:hypothetical protein ACK3TF_002919 [Chlorella vulgaris]
MSDLKPTQTGDQPPLQGREFDDSAKEASEHERAAPSGDHRLPPDPLHVSADLVPVHESGASGKLSRVAVGGAAPAVAGKAPGNPGTMTPLASLQHSGALSFRRRPEVWGWLQPAPGTKLPFVLLQGRGVAIGRGREAFHERLPQLVAALSHAASRMHSASATPSFGAAFSGSLATLSSIGMGSSALDFPSPFAAYALGSHTSGGGGGDRDSPTDGGSFVEVADGRVSRLHAWVKWDGKLQAAVLEDLSSNGTYCNGERVGRGSSRVLADGDRISLVLSVAPLAEQAFIYHRGDPRGLDCAAAAQWANDTGAVWLQRQASQGTFSSAAITGLASAASMPSSSDVSQSNHSTSIRAVPRLGSSALSRADSSSSSVTPGAGAGAGAAAAAASRRLSRCTTNKYTTPQAVTLEDLQCQICLCTLRDCVALEPCGHSFCAACLSHHLASLLESGQPLSCPLRCTLPERVVVNTAVRQLLSFGAAAPRNDAAMAAAAAMGPAALQPRHQHLAQHHSLVNVLETLPEVASVEGEGSVAGPSTSLHLPLMTHPSSGFLSMPSATDSHADSQPTPSHSIPFLHPQQQQQGAAAASSAAPAFSIATSLALSDGSTGGGASGSGTPTSYRHVPLMLGLQSASGSSLASAPASPFESQAFANMFSSRQPGGGGEAEGGQGPWALPGVPTMLASHVLGNVQSTDGGPPASGVLSSTAPTAQAEVPLPRRELSTASTVLHSTALPSTALQSVAAAAAAAPRAAPGVQAAGRGSLSSPAPPPDRASLPASLGAGALQGQSQLAAPRAALAQPPAGPSAAAAAGEGLGVEQQQQRLSAVLAAAASDVAGEDAMAMHPLCPLHDSLLPLDTSSLKSRQLTHSLELLQQSAEDDEEQAMTHLEAIARLAWSDEAARGELARLHGVQAILKCMLERLGSAGVHCNGCLALMALVRGEGDASDANRTLVAELFGVEIIAQGMILSRDSAMVQLSGLLCLVPLVLDSAALQARVAERCLPIILLALQQHMDEEEVVSKSLILLGVLGQGDGEAHELLRQTVMEHTPFPRLVARVLREYGGASEDVLWSTLFALAVIARATSESYVTHLLCLLAGDVLPALEGALEQYREVVPHEPDEMIARAGDYLVTVLRTARQLVWIRRTRKLTRLALVGLVAVVSLRWLRTRVGQRHTASIRQ